MPGRRDCHNQQANRKDAGLMIGAALIEIIEGIDRLEADQSAKREFGALVRAIGAAHGCSGIERLDRTAFARQLLNAGISRPTIRDRLIAMFGVSRPHAYRIISAALQLSRKTPGDDTT
jgi:hypothetical protein